MHKSVLGPRDKPEDDYVGDACAGKVIPAPLTFSYPCRTVIDTNAGPVSLPGAGGGTLGTCFANACRVSRRFARFTAAERPPLVMGPSEEGRRG